jgi:hypothetical protein
MNCRVQMNFVIRRSRLSIASGSWWGQQKTIKSWLWGQKAKAYQKSHKVSFVWNWHKREQITPLGFWRKCGRKFVGNFDKLPRWRVLVIGKLCRDLNVLAKFNGNFMKLILKSFSIMKLPKYPLHQNHHFSIEPSHIPPVHYFPTHVSPKAMTRHHLALIQQLEIKQSHLVCQFRWQIALDAKHMWESQESSRKTSDEVEWERARSKKNVRSTKKLFHSLKLARSSQKFLFQLMRRWNLFPFRGCSRKKFIADLRQVESLLPQLFF